LQRHAKAKGYFSPERFTGRIANASASRASPDVLFALACSWPRPIAMLPRVAAHSPMSGESWPATKAAAQNRAATKRIQVPGNGLWTNRRL